MKKLLRIASVTVAAAAVIIWIVLGGNMGWTRTSVPVKTLDEVTGIEGIEYRKQFKPGVELLLGALLGAAVLGSASLLFRNQPKKTTQQT